MLQALPRGAGTTAPQCIKLFIFLFFFVGWWLCGVFCFVCMVQNTFRSNTVALEKVRAAPLSGYSA